jgi:hypothetical protein
MFTWVPVISVAFGCLVFASCSLYYIPIGIPQLCMVCCGWFLSVILADMAFLRKKLVQVERELYQENRVLSRSRC